MRLSYKDVAMDKKKKSLDSKAEVSRVLKFITQ